MGEILIYLYSSVALITASRTTNTRSEIKYQKYTINRHLIRIHIGVRRNKDSFEDILK